MSVKELLPQRSPVVQQGSDEPEDVSDEATREVERVTLTLIDVCSAASEASTTVAMCG